MFRLTEENRPFPLQFIDVMSHTRTNSEDEAHQRIETHRTDEDAGRDLGFEWTGRTCFEFLKHKPPKGRCWVSGELVGIKTGMRPGHVTPYFWRRTGPNEKSKNGNIGQKRNPRERSREKNQIRDHIPDTELEEFKTLWQQSRVLWAPHPPAMPVHATINYVDGDNTYVRASAGEPDADEEAFVFEKNKGMFQSSIRSPTHVSTRNEKRP